MNPATDAFLLPARNTLKLALDAVDSQDNILLLCTRISYNQVCSYAKRSFHDPVVNITEHFNQIRDTIYPTWFNIYDIVDLSVPGLGGDPDEPLDADTYRLIPTGSMQRTAKVKLDSSSEFEELKLEYKAGYATIDLNDLVYNATVTQGIMVYRKKDFVGITNTTEVNPAPSDLAEIKLLASVKEMMNPLRYL